MNAASIQDPSIRRGAARWLGRETMGNLVLIAILFGFVGRWDWWAGWALVLVYVVWTVTTAVLILPVNPAMLAERGEPKAGTKQWDMVLLGILAVLWIADFALASLDVRLGWSPQFPWILRVLGLLVAVLGQDVLFVWAMVSNAFFIATVRIQSERQHRVSSGGPYRFIRHPGYLGAILLALGVPFLLNSWWALIPGMLLVLVMVIRTALEDKTLHAELPGYKEYAQTVRYRLLPGVW